MYDKISSYKKNVLIKCYTDGKSITESAEISGIKTNTAKTIIHKYNQNDGVLVEKKRGGKRFEKLSTTILEKIEQIVEENPAITLKNIRSKILESENVDLSLVSINNGLKRLRITLKNATKEVELRNAQTTLDARKTYALHFSNNGPREHQKIIFIDESGFNYHLRRTKGRSKVNTPARVTVPAVRGRNVSLIAAINTQGIVWHEVITHSTVTSTIFCDFLGRLFQKLENECNLDEVWLILDNASIHKTLEVRQLVDQTRHKLIFLPPYSPMLNPIEEVFSKIKMAARNLLADPCNQENLESIINASVQTITSANCYSYYMNMYIKLPAATAGEPL
jgi:transposase